MSARLAAAMGLIALGALGGRLLGERVRMRARTLELLAGDMERLRVAMLTQRLPRAEALARCESPCLREEGGFPAELRQEDRAFVQDFLERLGRGTAEEQALLLPRAQARLLKGRDEAKERYQTLARLYPCLGALGALALALMFV